MKRVLFVLVALLMSVSLFAQVSGSVASTSVYDADAETIAETIATTVNAGPLTIANTFTITQILLEAEIDWAGSIKYAVNEAITVGVSSSYGIDSEDIIPLTLSGSWTIADFISVSAGYTNDNLNGEEVEIGSFTIGVSLTF